MWPFNKPKEVRAAIAALEIEAEKFRANSQTLFGIDDISRKARRIIEGQQDKTIQSIAKDGLSPRALVHLVITNVVYETLLSGELHVYRGKLNQKGSSLFEVFRIASATLAEEGIQTSAEANADVADLKEQVSQRG